MGDAGIDGRITTNKLHGAESLRIERPLSQILRLEWNPKVHCRGHNSPPLVPFLNQMNPPSHPTSLRSNPILSSHLLPLIMLGKVLTENIKIPAKENLGYHRLKHNKS
jgi:hypothetical protein